MQRRDSSPFFDLPAAIAPRTLPARTSSVSRSMMPEQGAHDIHQSSASRRFSAPGAEIASPGADAVDGGRAGLGTLVHIARFPWISRAFGCRLLQNQAAENVVSEMPMPPDLVKDSSNIRSVSIERQTPVPVVSPNGPSPLHAAGHLRKHRVEEHRLELLRPLSRAGLFFCPSGEIFFQRVGEFAPRIPVAAVDQRRPFFV